MDNIEIKLPKSALSFYAKLYLKKRNVTNANSKDKTKILTEATKSWLSLSESEKQLIISKYDEHRNNLRKNFANHLKNAEPYLKKKINKIQTPDKEESTHLVTKVEEIEPEIETDTNHINDEAPMSSFNAGNERLQDDVQDYSGIVEYNDMVEPDPPKLLNGRELFNMINTDANITWESLTAKGKRKYRYAVTKIKRNYIKDYRRFLESLSSEKLYYYWKNVI